MSAARWGRVSQKRGEMPAAALQRAKPLSWASPEMFAKLMHHLKVGAAKWMVLRGGARAAVRQGDESVTSGGRGAPGATGRFRFPADADVACREPQFASHSRRAGRRLHPCEESLPQPRSLRRHD